MVSLVYDQLERFQTRTLRSLTGFPKFIRISATNCVRLFPPCWYEPRAGHAIRMRRAHVPPKSYTDIIWEITLVYVWKVVNYESTNISRIDNKVREVRWVFCNLQISRTRLFSVFTVHPVSTVHGSNEGNVILRLIILLIM